jgi:hypothetical protein
LRRAATGFESFEIDDEVGTREPKGELDEVREHLCRLQAIRGELVGLSVEQATLYRVLVAREAELVFRDDLER